MDKRGTRELVASRASAPSEAETGSIWQAVESLPDFSKACTLLLYWSFRSEVPTHDFIRKWSSYKRILLPVVEGKRLILREYHPDMMTSGYHGIMEPCPPAPEADPSEVDLAIVPGAAFDLHCRRLGRGGGFYDRLLPLLRKDCRKIGVCYNWQIVDSVPTDSWDFVLDAVVTPDLVAVEKILPDAVKSREN